MVLLYSGENITIPGKSSVTRNHLMILHVFPYGLNMKDGLEAASFTIHKLKNLLFLNIFFYKVNQVSAYLLRA